MSISLVQTINKNPPPPLQLLLQYQVLKWGLFIAVPVTVLVAIFIMATFSSERRVFGSCAALSLGCCFFLLYRFVLPRISKMRSMDLLSAAFLTLPTATYSWAIYQHPKEDLAGVVVGILVLASMIFVSHRSYALFALVSVGLIVLGSLCAGASVPDMFWLNLFLIMPAVAFITRMVVQKNYDLVLERLSNEKQLSAQLASTADALRMSQKDQEQSRLDLKQRDLQLSTVLSKAPIILCVTDRDGYYTQSRGFGLKKLGLVENEILGEQFNTFYNCLLYTSPSPRDGLLSRMPSSA